VKKHFRELGIDTQTQDFTVVGIGDMSGDVFGNGMLLSDHIRLIAAFDHRDVFIDPNPDAQTSLAERTRLFGLPRSSWAGYNPELISPGGGVFPRSAKSVTLTNPIREALGLEPNIDHLTPDELISVILKAPVDLLWNGGIGTYVKAQNESPADVGDKANDAIRVNGHQLRVRVVGEGGNLGLTQKGRVEAARHGVKLNTDAIDNSAGVDTSDREVNIKILLDGVVRGGGITLEDRNTLLAEMTDDVAAAVLRDNYDQNVVLGNARRGAPALITVHLRMIKEMERRGIIDRDLESLPDDEEFAILIAAESELTSPELAVLLAYSKNWLTSNLNKSTLSADPWFQATLLEYFPPAIRERFPEEIASHPLRPQIINTSLTNSLINVGGITFVYRIIEETGATVPQVVRAATAAMGVFDIRETWDWINSLDNTIPTTAQATLQLETRRLLDRATRWFLQFRGGELDIASEVATFRTTVADYARGVPEVLKGQEAKRFQRRLRRFTEAGAPEGLAREAAAALDVFSLLDITDVCSRTGEGAATVIPLYFTLSDRYDVDQTLIHITELPRGDRWTALARQALRTDLYQVIAALTARVIRATDPATPALERIENWEAVHAEGVSRARTTLQEIAAVENPDLATLSVCLRVLRNLVAQGDVTG
jgi:glutamate dehydrogenase